MIPNDDNTQRRVEKALETKALMQKTLEEWRTEGRFDYPLNEDGLVARLEDSRDMTKLLSNAVLQWADTPEMMMLLVMGALDEERFRFTVQMAVLAHMLVCDDPECGIKYPEKGVA